MQQRLRRWLIAGLVAGAGALVSAQITNVLNSASDLSGHTLVTAEGNRTITGTFLFSVPVHLSAGTSGAPGLSLGTDTTTGVQLGAGSVGFSLSGTQRGLLDSTGLTIFGQQVVDNTGALVGAVPSGAIFFFNGACPSGYTEFTSARGRYIVGLVSGGTLNSGIGTALTDLENRPVGQHTHAITDPGHSHTIPGRGSIANDSFIQTSSDSAFTAAVATGTSTTGITIQNSGSVAGTNAPYLELRACQKS